MRHSYIHGNPVGKELFMKTKDCPIRISGIYKIDFPNNKSYIGKAVDIKRRIKEHNTDQRQPILYSAITKYFNNNIEEFTILEYVPDRNKLTEREQFYINYYHTNNKKYGYNLTIGGDGASLGTLNVASKFSEEDLLTIKKLLETTDMPIYKIAEKYNCNRNTINRFDKGETYFNESYSYPLRKNKYKPKSGSNNGNAKIDENTYQNIVKDLKELKLSADEICKKYNIANSTLCNLNNGRTYKHNIEYPIRKKNAYLNSK